MSDNKSNMKTERTSQVSHLLSLQVLQYIIYGSVILYFGRDLFIPLSFSLLISFVLYPICIWQEKRKVGRMTAIVISVAGLMLLLLGLIALLAWQLVGFLNEWDLLKIKLSSLGSSFSDYASGSLGITPERQAHWLSQASDQISGLFFSMVQSTISFSSVTAVMVILIPVYTVLILYYRHQWLAILYRVFPHETKEEMRNILMLTIQSYYNFIKGMALVYLIVGMLNSIGLLILGVPHAFLFGFIVSVLTFIPYVGIVIGSLLPITMAWITYDSIWYPVGVIAVFTFIQYLEANIIFPLAVSSKLKLNTMIVLISIFAGGILWGVAGMILFVPFAGVIKLIADHNPKLKTLAMIFGVNDKPQKL
jgi:predicted PurR-regulated permease PerM